MTSAESTTNGATLKADPWELNEYEKQRKCHEPVTDPDKEIIINPKSLMSELMCPICLDVLRNTMTAKECLHRFCHDCITTALRSTNKECPTCRKKLVSRRSLRPDPNFDDLISKIYPNREESEAKQEQAMADLLKNPSTTALQRSIEEGMRMQAEIRKHKKLRLSSLPRQQSCPNGGNSFSELGDDEGDTTAGRKRMQFSRESSIDHASLSEASSSCYAGPAVAATKEVELVLRAHPDMDNTDAQMQDRYLKTCGYATVAHLKAYLAIRSRLDKRSTEKGDGQEKSETETESFEAEKEAERFRVYNCNENRFVEINSAMTLEALVAQKHAGHRRSPLTLFFNRVSEDSGSEHVRGKEAEEVACSVVKSEAVS